MMMKFLQWLSKHIPIVIIFWGIICRLHQYLINRSLWLDETHLAMNIINRDFSGLTKKLDYQQGAPILFLWVEKLLVNLFGNNEFAFRLFPLICGIASIFLFYIILKNLFDKKTVIIGLVLFCVGDQLIYYSAELKQYSIDTFICLILYFLSIVARRNNYNIFYVILFGFVGSISIWFSHPSIFILLSIGVVVFIKDKRLKFLIPLFMCGFSFLISYCISLSDLVSDKILLDFASPRFAPFPPKSLADIDWYIKTFFWIMRKPVGVHLQGMGFFCFIIGIITIYKTNRRLFFYFILPIVFTLIASMVHKYPFTCGRLSLFLIPCFLIFISEGVKEIIYKSHKIIGIGFTLILLFHPVMFSFRYLLTPRNREEIREIVKYLIKNESEDDKVYVYLGSVETSFKYYALKYNYKKQWTEGVDWIYLRNISDYINEINKFIGNNRVWFVFPHLTPAEAQKDEQIFIYCLNSVGRMIDCYKKTGAAIYLYNLSN